MTAFDPTMFRAFGAHAHTPLAQRLWDFLQARRRSLRDASDRGRVALEGLVDELELEFRNELDNQRIRQFVGAMIRHLMAVDGYKLVKEAARVRLGERFKVAALYERSSTPTCALVSAAQYIADVQAHLDWMETVGRAPEERSKMVELAQEWLHCRYDDEVQDNWLRTLQDRAS